MGALGILKMIFLAILALVLIVDLSLYVVATSVKDNVLSADFYSGVLERNNGYEKIQTLFIDATANSMSGQLPQGFTQDDVKTILKQSITTQWIKSESNKLIGNLSAYLTTDAVQPNLKVSTKEVKTKLISSLLNISMQKVAPAVQGQGVNQSAVEELFNISVPGKCTGQDCISYCALNPSDCQNLTMPSGLTSLIGKCGSPQECITYCQDPANAADCVTLMAMVSTPEMQALIAAQLESQLSTQIPDTMDLYQGLDSPTKVQLANAKSIFKQFNLVLTAMLVGAIVLAIIMILIIGITYFKGICKWVGTPLLVTGVILVIAGLFIPGVVMKGIPAEAFAGLGAANSVFIQNVLTDALRTLFSSIMVKGAIIAVIGIVMIVASLFLKDGEDEKEKTKKKK